MKKNRNEIYISGYFLIASLAAVLGYATGVRWLVATGTALLGLAISVGAILAAIIVPYALWVNRKSKR